MQRIILLFLLTIFLWPTLSLAKSNPAKALGNERIESFAQAKKILEQQVFFDHRITLYCQAPYDQHKNISLPEGFSSPKHEKRARRVEWEHVVPCENFGRAFLEWREGDPQCIDRKNQPFKGRHCAEKVNATYRLMQCDLYNLFPAIGAVNAIRSNNRYAALPDEEPLFGSCPMKIKGNLAEPPDQAKGQVARTALYMDWAYAPIFHLSPRDKKLFEAWSKQYPVTPFECVRAKRIQEIQGNINPFIAKFCQ